MTAHVPRNSSRHQTGLVYATMAATACIRLLLLFSAAGMGTTHGTHSCLSCQQWSLTACCWALPSQRRVGKLAASVRATCGTGVTCTRALPAGPTDGHSTDKHGSRQQQNSSPWTSRCQRQQAGAAVAMHSVHQNCASPAWQTHSCSCCAWLQVHCKQVSAQDKSAAAPSGAAPGMVSYSSGLCCSTSTSSDSAS
jgi:hypothetical protein